MAVSFTSVFTDNLDKDINKQFFSEYNYESSTYDKIAKIETAPAGGHITESELSGLGPLRTTPEGGQVTYDYPAQGNKKTRYYTIYTLGFQITKTMRDDDLTGNFMKMPKDLGRSAALKRETVFFGIFNNSFDSEVAMDGQYICVNGSHTALKTGTAINNRPATDAALSETSLQAALEYHMYEVVDDSGRPVNQKPTILLISPSDWSTAKVLLGTEKKVGSMDNDINVVYDEGIKWMVSRHLTSTTAWWLLSDQHDFRFVWKDKPYMSSADDFSTENAMYKVYTRFACFANKYRGVYGTTGA